MLLLLECFKPFKNYCPRLGISLLSKHRSMISVISFNKLFTKLQLCASSCVSSLCSYREHKHESKALTSINMVETQQKCNVSFSGGRSWEMWGTKRPSWKSFHHDPVYTCIYMYVQCVYTCIKLYVFTGLWYIMGVYMKQNNCRCLVLSRFSRLFKHIS